MNIDRTLRILSRTIPLLHAEIIVLKSHKARCWQKAEKGSEEGEKAFKSFCAYKARLNKVRRELKTANELIVFLKKQRKTKKVEHV
jgi:hypothetical protein